MKKLKIIIIDDHKTMRDYLRKILAEMGQENVEEASDGLEAWNQILEKASGQAPYDIIISDWNMPNLTGIELLKKIRKHQTE